METQNSPSSHVVHILAIPRFVSQRRVIPGRKSWTLFPEYEAQTLKREQERDRRILVAHRVLDRVVSQEPPPNSLWVFKVYEFIYTGKANFS